MLFMIFESNLSLLLFAVLDLGFGLVFIGFAFASRAGLGESLPRVGGVAMVNRKGTTEEIP